MWTVLYLCQALKPSGRLLPLVEETRTFFSACGSISKSFQEFSASAEKISKGCPVVCLQAKRAVQRGATAVIFDVSENPDAIDQVCAPKTDSHENTGL